MTLDETLRAAVAAEMAPLVRQLAELLACDPRTIVAMGERGEVVTRRCGRRIVVDAASLRPADPAEIATMARAARAGT